MNTGLTCRWDQDGAVQVLRLAGRLNLESAATVRTALRKCVADQPAAVVIDLGETVIDDDIALTVFTAFAHTAAWWPGCPVLLCAPAEPLRADLNRLAVSRAVPVYPDRRSALAAAAMLPPPRRYVEPLPRRTGACALARAVVDTACRDWQLSQVNDDAALVVTELVSNAVRHGHGDPQLRIVLGEYFLHLSVHDGNPEPPRRLHSAWEHSDGGRGLVLVDAVAAAWGSIPTGSGKTVWATLRIRPRPRPTPRSAAPPTCPPAR